MIQNFLILGGGFCSITQTQVCFSANIHGPIKGAIWRRAKFVRSSSFQSVDCLSSLIGAYLIRRPRYRQPNRVQQSVFRKFFRQLFNQFLRPLGIAGPGECIGSSRARIAII